MILDNYVAYICGIRRNNIDQTPISGEWIPNWFCLLYDKVTSNMHINYCRYTMEHRKASLAGLPPEMLKEITKVDRA